MSSRQTNSDAIYELCGAVSDSFRRKQSERLTRLEQRLAWLRHWTIIAAIAVYAYAAYQLGAEVHRELPVQYDGAEQSSPALTDDGNDEARSSLFLIFAAAVAGPFALFAGYLVFGFIYNVCRDGLVRSIPLARFMLVPGVLITGLMLLEARRDELKQHLLDGYAAVAHRIDSAKSLQRQARAMGERVRELRQMEAQRQALNDELQQEGGVPQSSRPGAPAAVVTRGASADAVAQDEAVRRLGELMLQVQGLSLPSQQPNGTPAVVDQPPAPATEGAAVSPAAAADI